jgi:hypothetical protein
VWHDLEAQENREVVKKVSKVLRGFFKVALVAEGE